MRPMPSNLGELEQLVLLALLRLGEEGYGVTVRAMLARKTRRRLSLGTIYKTLLRLEAKGLATAWLGEPTPERGGRRKKHYRVTPAGRRALTRSLNALRSLGRGLAPPWQGPGARDPGGAGPPRAPRRGWSRGRGPLAGPAPPARGARVRPGRPGGAAPGGAARAPGLRARPPPRGPGAALGPTRRPTASHSRRPVRAHLPPRSPLWVPPAGPEPGLHPPFDPDAGARHRRHHRDLLGGQSDPVPRASLPGRRPDRPHGRAEQGGDRRRHRLRDLPRRAADGDLVSGDRGLEPVAGDPAGPRRPRAARRPAGDPGLLLGAGCASVPGT